MATEGNGGLGTSEEVREGQLIGPTLESVAAFPMEDSTQNTSPWLESYIRKLLGEAFGHFVMSGPTSVAAFPMEDSMQNTSPWLESYIRKLVSEAFEHIVKSGPAMVGGRECQYGGWEQELTPREFRGNDNMVVRNTSSLGGNVNIPSSLRVNDNMEVRPVMHRSSLRGNVKCEGGGPRCTEMASMDSKFEELSVKEPVD